MISIASPGFAPIGHPEFGHLQIVHQVPGHVPQVPPCQVLNGQWHDKAWAPIFNNTFTGIRLGYEQILHQKTAETLFSNQTGIAGDDQLRSAMMARRNGSILEETQTSSPTGNVSESIWIRNIVFTHFTMHHQIIKAICCLLVSAYNLADGLAKPSKIFFQLQHFVNCTDGLNSTEPTGQKGWHTMPWLPQTSAQTSVPVEESAHARPLPP